MRFTIERADRAAALGVETAQWDANAQAYVLDLDSLEDLLELARDVGEELLVSPLGDDASASAAIIIYDDYLE